MIFLLICPGIIQKGFQMSEFRNGKEYKNGNTNSTIFNRRPPQSMEAEMAVIGAMLIDKQAISKVQEIISEECFYHEANRILFKTITEMPNKGITPDLVTLNEELKSARSSTALAAWPT
jgi:hypothetical protein